jgi:hypothetical protein
MDAVHPVHWTQFGEGGYSAALDSAFVVDERLRTTLGRSMR